MVLAPIANLAYHFFEQPTKDFIFNKIKSTQVFTYCTKQIQLVHLVSAVFNLQPVNNFLDTFLFDAYDVYLHEL